MVLFCFFILKNDFFRSENTEVDWYFNDLTNIKALISEKQKISKREHTSL